jgi:hypothetical protein
MLYVSEQAGPDAATVAEQIAREYGSRYLPAR